jgi:hypothetical protein
MTGPHSRRSSNGGVTVDKRRRRTSRLGRNPRRRAAAVDASAYRILQEGLTNVRKHAGAAHAEVVIAYRPDGVELSICDDGRSAASPPVAGHAQDLRLFPRPLVRAWGIDIKGADPNIYVVPRRGGEARRITGVGLQEGPDWSPDGRPIAYSWGYYNLSYDAVRVLRPDGTGEAPVTDDAKDPAWAPSGIRLAISRGGQIWTVTRDGSRLRRVTDIEAEKVSHYDPTWQPR